jgi:general secretion pathway protein G
MENSRFAENHRRRRTASAGFTLIEIMAVVVIMAMLMGLVGVNIKVQIDKARVSTTKAQIVQLESALEFYRMDSGRYPTTAQGLMALISKPAGTPEPRSYPPGGYLKRSDAIRDPWGEQFQYENPGTHNAHAFDIWSFGSDGSSGGEDTGTDIGNWDDNREAGA